MQKKNKTVHSWSVHSPFSRLCAATHYLSLKPKSLKLKSFYFPRKFVKQDPIQFSAKEKYYSTTTVFDIPIIAYNMLSRKNNSASRSLLTTRTFLKEGGKLL